jgi:hypothetical protein
MNKQHEQTIEVNGRIYQYDPDCDCYYRVPVELSTFDKYAWIVTAVVLLALVIFLEWYRQ